jgi:hypothetical protein
MKTYFPVCILFFISLFSSVIYSQSFPYEEYKNRTLSELVEMDSDVVKTDYKEKQLLIHAKPFYSAIRLKYVGTSRPISAEKKNLFKLWQGSLGMDAKVLTLLENEFLFKECDKEYWIPVQKQVAAYFPKEMQQGDMITLYLMVVGGLKTTNKWEFVYLTQVASY